MKKLETKLKQLQNAHTMSDSERKQLRASLSEYMELNPIRLPQHAARSPLSLHYLWQHKLVSATLVLAIFFTSGAGATYASTDALPGDTLYSVKELVEEVHGRMLFSDVAKAQLAETLAERREAELKRLEQLGKLDDEKIAIINKRMQRHKARAARVLKRIESSDPEQAAQILKRINNKAMHVQGMQIERLNMMFETQMQKIEQEYAEQEQNLRELESDIKELDQIIPSI